MLKTVHLYSDLMGLSSAIHGGRGRGVIPVGNSFGQCWSRYVDIGELLGLHSPNISRVLGSYFWKFTLSVCMAHISFIISHLSCNFFCKIRGALQEFINLDFFLSPPLWMLKLTHRMGFVMVPGNCYKLYIIAHLFTLRVREELEGGTWGYLPPVLGIHFVVHSCSTLSYW